MSVAVVILAAGESTRMGSPKQLLQYKGRSLLRRSAEIALASTAHPVVVVLGANSSILTCELNGLPVHIVENPDWSQGMNTSIRAGIESVLENEAVVILLCDQPHVTADSIDRLEAEYRRTHARLVASSYGGAVGVPALFDRSLFPDLLSLPQGQGAKVLIERERSRVSTIALPEASIDIDTPADYVSLQYTES